MSEHTMVQETPEPRTRQSLAHDLRQLGIQPGMTLLAHSSLSSLGWVCGGAVAVVQALMDVLTSEGTLVMPTQSGDLSDPTHWQRPPVPREWWPIIQETMPAYDPHLTPTRGMGAVVEVFRTLPSALRSSHPNVSFAAWGKHAERVIAQHSLDYGLGESSPLARMYELDGSILLLGVGYDSCTTLHLAEYRAPGGSEIERAAPIIENGQRVWKTYRDIDIDSDVFPELGTDFERSEEVTIGKIGSATCRFIRQRPLVDFGIEWITRRRQANASTTERNIDL